MLVDIFLMRCRGRRLPWRDIENGRVYRGDLRTVTAVGNDHPVAAHLVTPDGVCKHILPALHEPAFMGVGAEVFHLRGIERLVLDDGVYAVVQEWRCTPVR
ncbi:MAG: hypothetical protein H6R18_1240 [Proteobacteria bacterium]|nr:hypothetical protein [Pseudomonadota bacterium]